MAQPYRGGRTPVDTGSGSAVVGARYPRAVPEFLEVEIYRQLAEEALDRTIASVISTDAWFLKGATTGPALRRALVGREFVAARRIGKLLLLDVDSGPDRGHPVRDDRHPAGRRPRRGGRHVLRPQASPDQVGPVEGALRGRRLPGGPGSPPPRRGPPRAGRLRARTRRRGHHRRPAGRGPRGVADRPQGPAARPVQGGGDREPLRRRAAVAGRALPAAAARTH